MLAPANILTSSVVLCQVFTRLCIETQHLRARRVATLLDVPTLQRRRHIALQRPIQRRIAGPEHLGCKCLVEIVRVALAEHVREDGRLVDQPVERLSHVERRSGGDEVEVKRRRLETGARHVVRQDDLVHLGDKLVEVRGKRGVGIVAEVESADKYVCALCGAHEGRDGALDVVVVDAANVVSHREVEGSFAVPETVSVGDLDDGGEWIVDFKVYHSYAIL